MSGPLGKIDKKVSMVDLQLKEPWTFPHIEELRKWDQSLTGKEPEEPLPITAQLYVHYTQAVKKLDKLWDEEYQPQKGLAIRRLMDAATRRLVELKDMLVEIDMHEYHYVDGAYIQLHLIPREFEVLDLQSLPKERDPELQEMIEALIKRGERIYEPPVPEEEEVVEGEFKGEEEEEEVVKEEQSKASQRDVKASSLQVVVSARPYLPVIPVDPKLIILRSALLLIQSHERARQGRLEFFDAFNIFKIRRKMRRPALIPPAEIEKSALTIQKWYRGYLVRKDLREREIKRRLLIGMYMPSYWPHDEADKVKVAVAEKRKIREEKLKEYIELIGRERDRLARVVAPGLAEDIGDEIRYWFREWYDRACCFDKYPPEEKGGTILVIRGETMTPEEYLEKQEKLKEEKDRLKNNPAMAAKAKQAKEKAKKAALAAAKKEKERLKKEAKELKKLKEKGLFKFKFEESPALKQIEEGEELYGKEWLIDMEPDKNPKRQTVMKPITEELMYELQLQVRKEVDVLMELELQLLEKALAKERHKRYRKPRKKKKKKGKGGKKGGKTAIDDRSIEEMFQELYDNGIIHEYPEVSFDDFFGDHNYANGEWRIIPGPPLDPLPSQGDIRNVVMNTCVMPLVDSEAVRPKSVCIAGPRQSGKKTLVYAVCNATKAVLFDITPSVLKGLYEDKQQKKIFILMLNKLMRVLQPSIIFLDGGEKPFYKKVPKPERKEKPKKLKPLLTKGILKKLNTVEDRVMVIATSKTPWNSRGKQFVKTFEHFIMLPRTDYGTVYMMLTKLLMRYPAIQRGLDLSAITSMTIGYPLPVIQQVIEEILTPRRIVEMNCFNKKFQTKEILEHLIKGKGIQPVTEAEQQQFTKWYNTKVPIGKRRTKLVEEAEAQRIMEEMQAEKQKGKKK